MCIRDSLYYELHNFYQNHRLYVKSRSFDQLRGDKLQGSKIDRCDPITKNRDLEVEYSHWGHLLDPNGHANPCGIAAKSIFNDEFTLLGPNGPVSIDNEQLTWDSDFDYMYSRSKDYQEDQWLDVEDERFAVWMKIAVHPSFRKLWGVINSDLDKGDYVLTVRNNSDVGKWDGEKHFALTEANSLGGRNVVLGAVLVTGGMISAIVAVAACILSVTVKIDPSDIKWK